MHFDWDVQAMFSLELRAGNSDSVPFLWTGDDGTTNPKWSTCTLGFGLSYFATTGNFHIIRKGGTTTNQDVLEIARTVVMLLLKVEEHLRQMIE